MPLTTVNPNSTDIEHLASVDVKFSGTHIGGGIYLATNHDPNTDGRVRTAIPQRSLNGEGEKLSENWIFIDLLHFWKGLGVDILSRTTQIPPNGAVRQMRTRIGVLSD
ncbi:hypothetical protein N8Z59_03475 [Planktomarina temperata]|nr:hypothetical protein [Planktomarina temperata]